MHKHEFVPDTLVLLAGKGVYPRLLAESAKQQGVKRLCVVAFKGETERAVTRLADESHWIRLGQLNALMETLRQTGANYAVMAGQLTPTSLFNVRMDSAMLALLRGLKLRNAETIFGAVGEQLAQIDMHLLPASSFMTRHMPETGLLTTRPPTDTEVQDIRLGYRVAKTTSGLDIGQTVVVKQGTILAVEAFEGTDETIRRAGKLGGPGSTIVKVAKPGHDMRFDIPVIGLHTLKVIAAAKAATLAVETGRCILLEREKVLARAEQLGLCMAVLTADGDVPATP